MIFLLLLACSTGDQSSKSENNTQTNCENIKVSLERDKCLAAQIETLNEPQINEVISKAKIIEDTMIRGAAVSAWVRAHNNEINQQQGQKLCEILDGRDRFYCMRRLSSPHLKR